MGHWCIRAQAVAAHWAASVVHGLSGLVERWSGAVAEAVAGGIAGKKAVGAIGQLHEKRGEFLGWTGFVGCWWACDSAIGSSAGLHSRPLGPWLRQALEAKRHWRAQAVKRVCGESDSGSMVGAAHCYRHVRAGEEEQWLPWWKMWLEYIERCEAGPLSLRAKMGDKGNLGARRPVPAR